MKNRQIKLEAAYEVKTPRQLRKYHTLSDAEYMFCELITLCHRSANTAYKLAFGSSASLSSCAALASRKIREEEIKEHIELLTRYYGNNQLPPCEKYSI